MPDNYFNRDEIDNGLNYGTNGKCHSYNKYHSIGKPFDLDDEENFTTFHTIATKSHRSSLPIDNKYNRRSSLQNSKKYHKNKDTKSRPKPLQVGDNEQYYNHIFPVKKTNLSKANCYFNKNVSDVYFQPSSIDRAEL